MQSYCRPLQKAYFNFLILMKHYIRISVRASSGQALTHSPQASHRSAWSNTACCHLWPKPFNFPLKLRLDLITFGRVSTPKTPTGQTLTQSALPSHLLRSIVGAKIPGSCLHSSWFSNKLISFVLSHISVSPIIKLFCWGRQEGGI